MGKMIKELSADDEFATGHALHNFMYQRSDNDVVRKVTLGDIIGTILGSHISTAGDISTSMENNILTFTVHGTGTKWYFANEEPDEVAAGDIWLNTDNGEISEYVEDEWVVRYTVGSGGGGSGKDGITPHIDATTKHWMIGDTDTGVVAEGKDGTNGTNGTNGTDGVTPHINSSNKHWMIGSTDTNIIAEGQNGTNGTNGVTPHISTSNKHWMIGDTDTGVVAEGQDGAKGDSGDDGASISATVSTITGGHRITISSTDSSAADQTIDVMDGTEVIQTSSDDRIVALPVSGWQGTSAPFTQTVTILGMTSSVVPILGLAVSSTVETGLEELSQWGRISRATTGTDTITVYCYRNKPNIDLNVIVKVV